MWSGIAHAQEPSIKELYDNGQVHFDSGQYDLAIDAWSEAYQRSARPLLLMKLGDAWEELGRYDLALESLQMYREMADEAEVAAIEERLAKLEALAAASPPPQPEPDPVVATVEPVEPLPPEPVPLPRGRSAGVEIGLVAVAVGGVATGTISGLNAQAARREALDSCVGPSSALICQGSARDALKRDQSASTLADIGFIVGGTAVVSLVAYELFAGGPVVQLSPRGLALQWTIR